MRKAALVLMMSVVLMLCAVVQAWTPPAPVTNGINTLNDEVAPFLSNDGQTLYFSRGNGSNYDIWQATRQGASGPFTSVTKALDRGSAWTIFGGWVSSDNLRMYYHEEAGSWSMKMSTRTSVSDPWTGGTVIPGLSSFSAPVLPRLTQNELTIVFDAYNSQGGNYDMYMATRSNTSSPFGNITSLSTINSSAHDQNPYITPDGLALYFSSVRNGSNQLFKATRASLGDPFGNLEHLSFFDSTYGSSSMSLSADGTILFYSKGMSPSGYRDIYFSEIPEPATLLLLSLGTLIFRKKSQN